MCRTYAAHVGHAQMHEQQGKRARHEAHRATVHTWDTREPRAPRTGAQPGTRARTTQQGHAIAG
eukprot:14938709-Alexandrium_andersonii.AAC.1